MNVVLFFQSTVRKSWRQKLAGAFRFAKERDWLVQVAERAGTPGEIREAVATWRPVGCLVDRANAAGRPPDAAFGDVPVVYLDQDPAQPSAVHPCVVHDSAATVALAARELLSRPCRSCGFAGMEEPRFWCRERAAAFRAAAASAGLPFDEFRGRDVGAWLAKRPLPCAVLAANDYVAQRVHHAARAAGLRVPDDVAICGIDNDELYCEAVWPGITSVEPDFENAGYRLAARLAREIEAPGTGSRTETYGPLRLVRRGSTRLLAGPDPRVRRAAEFIRRNAARRGLGIGDVAAEMGCSRRLATLRFRAATGRSILEEIHEARFALACDLLRGTDKPVFLVVSECGYASESFFKRMFLARTGTSMREWRRRARAGGPPRAPGRNATGRA